MAATNAPKPAGARRRRNTPERGEWQVTAGAGWRYGVLPAAPARLTKAAREAWDVWMRAWFAAHWTPDDLPGLRQVIRLYDQVERGAFQRAAELRLSMDTYGITPKGQQDRRWVRPVEKDDDATSARRDRVAGYSHLRAVK